MLSVRSGIRGVQKQEKDDGSEREHRVARIGSKDKDVKTHRPFRV
jgi:hypothetical protein